MVKMGGDLRKSGEGGNAKAIMSPLCLLLLNHADGLQKTNQYPQRCNSSRQYTVPRSRKVHNRKRRIA
jgi:hypothetical protein